MIDINWSDPVAVIFNVIFWIGCIIGIIAVLTEKDDGGKGGDVHDLSGDE